MGVSRYQSLVPFISPPSQLRELGESVRPPPTPPLNLTRKLFSLSQPVSKGEFIHLLLLLKNILSNPIMVLLQKLYLYFLKKLKFMQEGKIH